MFYSYFDYLCKQKGVSKNKACQEMGVSRNVAAKWKSTNTNPNMKTLGRISEYFGVSIDELLKHSNEKENPATESDGLEENGELFIVSDYDKRFLAWFHSIPPEKRRAILISQDAPEELL